MNPGRRTHVLLGLLALVVAVTAVSATTANGTKTPVAKPVIGRATATPAKPLPGKRFTVSFKVTRSDTGARLTTGTMVCDPSVGGKVIRHTESFTNGTARLSFVVPPTAAGKVLKVRLTIAALGGSATKITVFPIRPAVKPSLSIADVAVTEGNAGTTTLAFPLQLSSASVQAISVQYATADGTATAGSDYVAASGKLTFSPGETAKTITVTVNGDTAVEPDETLTVSLSNPVNATLVSTSATATIRNDDVAALPGHYQGRTADNELWAFDIASNGLSLSNLRTGQINESCSPPLYLSGGNLTLRGPYPVATDGSFTINANLTGTVGGSNPLTARIAVTGKVSGGAASGTYHEDDSFTYNGTAYGCTTGDQTWTATRQ